MGVSKKHGKKNIDFKICTIDKEFGLLLVSVSASPKDVLDAIVQHGEQTVNLHYTREKLRNKYNQLSLLVKRKFSLQSMEQGKGVDYSMMIEFCERMLLLPSDRYGRYRDVILSRLTLRVVMPLSSDMEFDEAEPGGYYVDSHSGIVHVPYNAPM